MDTAEETMAELRAVRTERAKTRMEITKIQERQTEIIKNSNAGHKNTKSASTGNGRGESSSRPQKKKSIRNVHKRK